VFDPAIIGELPIADTLTSGLLELAWESLKSVIPQSIDERPTGIAQQQMLSRLVAAAWRGAAAPALVDQATAQRVGKRLLKQVDTKLQGLLRDAFTRAVCARTALTKSSVEEGLESMAGRLAEIDRQETEDCAAARRAPYNNFPELDQPEEPAAVESAAVSADTAADERVDRLMRAQDVLRAGPDPFAAWMQRDQDQQAAAAQEEVDELAEKAERESGVPAQPGRRNFTGTCARYRRRWLRRFVEALEGKWWCAQRTSPQHHWRVLCDAPRPPGEHHMGRSAAT